MIPEGRVAAGRTGPSCPLTRLAKTAVLLAVIASFVPTLHGGPKRPAASHRGHRIDDHFEVPGEQAETSKNLETGAARNGAITHAPVFRGQRIDYEIEVPSSQGGTRNLDIGAARIGDFDGDGRPELLAANDPCYNLGGITLVRLRPEGGIGSVDHTPVSGSTCTYSASYGISDTMTIGDFDGDRRVDVTFWQAGLLYRMTPSGTFMPTHFSLPLDPTEGYESPPYLVSADLNGDGMPDVVVSQPFFVIDFETFNIRDSTNLYVFLADGQGGFRRSQKSQAPADPVLDFRLIPISAKDFNHDGKVDLLAVGSGPLGGTEILLGDGAGQLSPPQAGLPVSPQLPSSLRDGSIAPSAIDDLNGDHLPDLVYVLLESGKVESTIYLSTAPGRFEVVEAQSELVQGSIGYLKPATIADLDDDGRMDFEVSGDRWTVPFLQESDGQFHAGPVRRLPLRANGVILFRWDEDALVDKVYFGDQNTSYNATSHPTLSVFLNHGFPNRDLVDLDLSAERQAFTLKFRAGDFDGDHHQDIAVGTLDGIQVFRGDGRGGFFRELGLSSPGNFGFTSMVPGDWNADGRTDLAFLRNNPSALNSPGSLTIYLAQSGVPRFAAGVTVPVGPRPMKAVPVDLNRDGHLDLMVGGSGVTKPGLYGLIDGNAVSVLGDGHGGFAPAVPVYTLPPGYYNPEFLDVDADDIDADGVPDLILLAKSSLYLPANGYWGSGHGDGTFEIPYYFGSPGTPAPARLLKPRDLNGDGLTDLSLGPSWSGFTFYGRRVYLGTLEGDFHFTVASECCTYAGEFVDLEGDGFMDLVARQDYDSLSVGIGSGTGEFLAEKTYYSPAGEYLSGRFEEPLVNIEPIQADFDEDGRVDVATLDIKGHVTVLFNRSDRLASDPEESLDGAGTEALTLDLRIDVLEIQGRPGAYDFGDEGGREGALVFTLHLERPEGAVNSEEWRSTAGVTDREDAKDSLRDGGRPALPPPPPVMVQINFNFGELLKDTNGDGALDLSIANAAQEPGLARASLADVKLLFHAGENPRFTGMEGINRFSSYDPDRGIVTFVIPFGRLLSRMTPSERAAMDRGDGNGRLFVWAFTRLYGDMDRIPDTNDGDEPTIRDEVREFIFPLRELHFTPSFDFGDVRINRVRQAPLTLSNRGVLPLEIDSIQSPDATLTTPGQFPLNVPPIGQLQIGARYLPVAHERMQGFLELLPGTDRKIWSTGRGVAPILRVSSMQLDFGSMPIGLTSSYRSFYIENVGDAPLDTSWELIDPLQFNFNGYIPPPGPYAFYLYPGEHQTFNLTFTPTKLGASQAAVRIVSDDDVAPLVDVSLLGTGTPPEPRIQVSGYSSNDPMRDVPIGGEASTVFDISNGGSGPLQILGLASDNPHFTASVSANVIQPKERANLTVTYRPVAWGQEAASITISSNDPTQPSLSRVARGYAFEPPPEIHVAPTELDFGTLHQGESATLSFEVENRGAGPLHLLGGGLPLPVWCRTQSDLVLPATLMPGTKLTAHVTYTADIDKYPCSFSLDSNDPSLSWVPFTITATILSPLISLSTNGLQFQDTQVGAQSIERVTAYNQGPDILNIRGVSLFNSYNDSFALATPLPVSVPPGGSTVLELVYAPKEAFPSFNYLILQTNDLDRREVWIYVSGKGIPASVMRSVGPALE